MPLLFALYIALIPSPVIRLMDTYCFTSRTKVDYFRIGSRSLLGPRNGFGTELDELDGLRLAVCSSGFNGMKIEGRG